MNGPIGQFERDRILVAPSILAADFANLGDELARIEEGGADIVHVDVMDGHFVPNISLGPPVVEKIRSASDLTFDVHLMLARPDDYIEAFAKAGADHITIHVESEGDTRESLARIRRLGCSAGLCLKPETPATVVEPFLDQLAMILVMTVEPGFGGQRFMTGMLAKIRAVRAMSTAAEKPFWVEVDGGVDEQTAPLAIAAGANVLVAGTSVFRNPLGTKKAIGHLRTKG